MIKGLFYKCSLSGNLMNRPLTDSHYMEAIVTLLLHDGLGCEGGSEYAIAMPALRHILGRLGSNASESIQCDGDFTFKYLP